MSPEQRRALVCGVSGQDGAYLARFLISKGYRVFGASRDAQTTSFDNLRRLGIRDQVEKLSMTLNDFRSVLQVLTQSQPHEIYNLAGQSSVNLSFQQPVETLESITIGALNLLEAIRFSGLNVRLYNACSSECFGNTADKPANEATGFRPRSPYAVAKAGAFWEVVNYRESYDLFACSGILFNHDSCLRPERFVTQKVVGAACRIATGSKERLHLGNMSIMRDWGWAPEYVDAMWRMMQQDAPDDYVIATGETKSLEDFVQTAFAYLDLDWRAHTEFNPGCVRITDLQVSRADASKASLDLDWRAQYKMADVVRMMVDGYQQRRDASS